LTQLIRDLFDVKCSQTEALNLLLNSGSSTSIPPKLGNNEGTLQGKMLSFIRNRCSRVRGTFSAIPDAAAELIVYWKISSARRRPPKSGSSASIPRKLGNREGSLQRKMLSGKFLAIPDAVAELIVCWKILLAGRHMDLDARAMNLPQKRGS
jgi:hypothetical protein